MILVEESKKGWALPRDLQKEVERRIRWAREEEKIIKYVVLTPGEMMALESVKAIVWDGAWATVDGVQIATVHYPPRTSK